MCFCLIFLFGRCNLLYIICIQKNNENKNKIKIKQMPMYPKPTLNATALSKQVVMLKRMVML